MNGDIGVRRVRLSRKKFHDHGGIETFSNVFKSILEIIFEIALIFLDGEFVEFPQRFHVGSQGPPYRDPILYLLDLREYFSRSRRIVPEIRLGGKLFLFLYRILKGIRVKDAPRYR